MTLLAETCTSGPCRVSVIRTASARWIQYTAFGRKRTSISFTMGIFWGGKCGTNKSTRTIANIDYTANVQLRLISLIMYFWPTFFLNEGSEWSEELDRNLHFLHTEFIFFKSKKVIISHEIHSSLPRLLHFSDSHQWVTRVRYQSRSQVLFGKTLSSLAVNAGLVWPIHRSLCSMLVRTSQLQEHFVKTNLLRHSRAPNPPLNET